MRKLILAIGVMLALASPAFAGQHCSTWCDANGSGHCETNCR